MESSDPVRERVSSWARRSVELNLRINALHERNAQLAASLGPPDLDDRRAVGSTPDQVAKAQALARTANVRAVEAIQRAAMMRLHAAGAHDRAARLHEVLADAGRGDVAEHREKAATHREQAREDRAAADRIIRSAHSQRTE